MRRKEIEVAYRTLVSAQGFLRAEQDGIGRRAHLLNIEPLSCGNAKAPALARCVERNSVVLAKRLPCFIDKEAWFFGFGNLLLDERTVVSLSDKADLLTFLQLVGWEPQGLRLFPDVRFSHVAQREEEFG